MAASESTAHPTYVDALIRSGADDTVAAFNASLTTKTRLMPGGALGGFQSEYEDEALLAELLGAAPTFATLRSQTEGKIEEDTLRLLLQRFQRKGLVALRN